MENKTKIPRKKIAILAISLLIVAGILFYFIVISPFASKPFLKKPAAPKPGERLTSEQVMWVVNELGAYSLHPTLSGEKPEMQISITDTNQTFSIVVENGKSNLMETPSSPDIKIITATDSFAKIIDASDINKEITSLYNQKMVSIEILKDVPTLLLKGYKSLYDSLSPA